jgi:2'-5' RNA ligase
VFIGDVPETDLNRLAATVDRISRKPFNIGVDRLACFARGQVAWLGTSHPPLALMDMQTQLQYEVEKAGFNVDQRRFQPHITVARKVQKEFDTRTIDVILWSVRTLCLVHSDTKPEGTTYQVIKTWKL